MTDDRKTFTVPDGFEAVRDEEGRATGEVRPTQPTTQAIQQAREIAADSWPKGGTMHRMLLAGKLDGTEPVQIALQALLVSASERAGPYGYLIKPIGLMEDDWRLSFEPSEYPTEEISVPLFADEEQQLGVVQP